MWASKQGTDPGSLRSPGLGGWVVISRKAKDFIRSFKNHSSNCVGQIKREQPGGQAGSGYILRLKQMSLGEGLGGGTEETDRPITAWCLGPEAAHQLQQERMCRMCVCVHTCAGVCIPGHAQVACVHACVSMILHVHAWCPHVSALHDCVPTRVWCVQAHM